MTTQGEPRSRRRRRGVVFGLALTILLGLGAGPPAPARAQVSVSVGPSLVEIVATPGATGEQVITVANGGAAPLDLIVGVEPYRGATGDASAVAWLTAEPSSLRIEPGAQQAVTVRIAVPRGLRAGGRYAMVTVTTDGQTVVTGTGTAIAGKLGVPFLIAVDGDGGLRRGIGLERFVPVLEPDGRIAFRAGLRNTGNLHVVAEGGVLVARADGTPLGSLVIPPTMAILPGHDALVSTYGSLPLATDETFAATLMVAYGAETPATAMVEFSPIAAMAVTQVEVCENLDRAPTLRLRVRNDGELGLLPLARLTVHAADGRRSGTVAPWPTLLWPGATGELVVDLPERLLSGEHVLALRLDYAAPFADGRTVLPPLERETSFRIGGLDGGAAPLCAALPAGEVDS